MAPLILKLGNIEMSGQSHAPAVFFSGRNHRKTPEPVRTIWVEKNILLLTGCELRTDQRLA
jgi:hypothetical protein